MFKTRLRLLLVVAAVNIVTVAGTALAVNFDDVGGIRVNHLRRKANATLSGTTNYNTSLAELRSSDYFPVDTSAPGGATLDVDLGDDAAIGSDDLGSKWRFQIVVGGSALTVTAGASGFTTITTIDASGTTCEDAGDAIECTAYTTAKAVCLTQCAD